MQQEIERNNKTRARDRKRDRECNAIRARDRTERCI